MKTYQTTSSKSLTPIPDFYWYILMALVFQACQSGTMPDSSPTGFDRLVRGKIAHDIPEQMKVGENYRAVASVTKALNDSILFIGLDREKFDDEDIWVSSRVKIVLFDPTANNNFEIMPLNTEEQTVDEFTNTIWEWNVKPVKSGSNPLVMRATVKVLDDFGENYRDIPVFEKSVRVKASPIASLKMFVAAYWQWLLTVIILPLIPFFYNMIKKRWNKQ